MAQLPPAPNQSSTSTWAYQLGAATEGTNVNAMGHPTDPGRIIDPYQADKDSFSRGVFVFGDGILVVRLSKDGNTRWETYPVLAGNWMPLDVSHIDMTLTTADVMLGY